MTREKSISPPTRHFPWLPAIALFLLAIIAYIPSLKNGFIWDDPAYVVENPTLKSAEGLWSIWTDPTSTPQYYPMVHTTFWIEAQFPGGTDHAIKFHVDNILLHALAAILLWRCLVPLQIPAAWLAAAIFAVHPVMVESVTWVTERKNVLSMVFYLSAFLAYRRSGLMNPSAAPDVHPGLLKNRWYLLSLLFFLLALLSKTVTCSLPAAILLVIWWERKKRGQKPFSAASASAKKASDPFFVAVKPLFPMFLLGLSFSAITSHLEHTSVGARGADFDWSILDRCLIAGHAICFYAVKLVWPHPLIFMYPKWDLQADRAMQLIYPAVVVLAVMALWFARNKIGRGPLVAVLFFIGTLFPALGFVNVYPMRYSCVADHFQYLASIGLITLIAAVLWRISKFSVVVILPLAWLAWQQQAIYADAKTLWENTLAQNPDCWMAHTNLSNYYRAENRFDDALRESRRALELAPNEADTQYDYGLVQAKRGQWNEAIEHYRLAIQCDSDCVSALNDLGRVLWDHDDSPQAEAEAYAAAQKALQLHPGLGDPHYVFARVAELRGDLAGAVSEYHKALEIDDQDYHSHYLLGNLLLQSGHPREAAGEFEKVLKIRPGLPVAIEGLKKSQAR